MTNFIKNFFQNNGAWVATGTMVTKFSSFLVILFASRWLTKNDFGEVSAAINFLGFFVVFTGFGSYQGMLRFGAIVSPEEREKLKAYSFSYGMLIQLIICLVMAAVAWLIYRDHWSLLSIILLFNIRFFGVYLLEQAKAETRADFNNKKYALLDILSSVSLVLLVIILIQLLGKDGYIWALCVSPFAVLLIHKFKLSFSKKNLFSFTERDFWKFSVTSAMGGQVAEWLFLIDIFFISLIINQTAVAEYRISNTIPINLMFLAYVFLQTGYPELCKQHLNKDFQKKYLRNYLKSLIPISFVILAFGLTFPDALISLFGKHYEDSSIFKILIFGTVSVILIRAPFGYLLSALGKPAYTLGVSVIMLVIISIAYYFIIPKYGLKGVAYTNVFGLTLSGILYGLAYFYELKKIKS